MKKGELIVLWKSPSELSKDRIALHAELMADIAKTTRLSELVRAIFENDTKALFDASPSEIVVAKAEAARIEPEFFGGWGLYATRRFADCLKRDQERCAAHERLKRRSEHFCKRMGMLQ